jgi:signal transduction histidine kinase
LLNRGRNAHETEKAIFDPSTLIYELTARFADRALDKKLSFEVKELGEKRPLALRLSKEDFIAVLDPVLANAVRFSREGSVITIQTEVTDGGPNEESDGVQIVDLRSQTRQTVQQYNDLLDISPRSSPSKLDAASEESHEKSPDVDGGPWLVVRVSDTGIGIPAQDVQSIGEPFRQASNSPDQSVRGRGLGLAIAQKLLTACQGGLYCKSQEGVGTTLSLFIPMA